VVVISPHQNNFAMPLRVEVWPAEPPSDLDDWQEAFLTGLVVGPRRPRLRVADHGEGDRPRAAGPLRRPHHRPRLRQPRLARVDHARRPLAPPSSGRPPTRSDPAASVHGRTRSRHRGRPASRRAVRMPDRRGTARTAPRRRR
jgi:hypothetical protein